MRVNLKSGFYGVSLKIETLRFSRLNERNVSLVAICAVI